MDRRLTRRAVLGVLAGGVASLSGCVEPSRPQCDLGMAYSPYRRDYHVIPERERLFGDSDSPGNADPEKVPLLQRRVSPGVRVEVATSSISKDTYAFRGDVGKSEVEEACEWADVPIYDIDRRSGRSEDRVAMVENRLKAFRNRDLDLSFVAIETVEEKDFLVYDEETPEDVCETWNDRLGSMGTLSVSAGHPIPDLWRPYDSPDSLRMIEERTLSFRLEGKPIRSILSDYRVEDDPESHAIRLFIDGEQVATRALTEADITDDRELVDPTVTIEFDSHEEALVALTTLSDPIESRLNFLTSCD